MYNVIKLDYYDEFKCIGADCKNSCCKGWEVTMSKSDYSRLMSSKNLNGIADIVSATVKRIRDGHENINERYAEFTLENGECPLHEDGWCLMQKKCGENALVDICHLFPRNATVSGNVVIKCCTLACEAVVADLMKRKEGLKLVFEESNYEPDLLKTAYAIKINQLKHNVNLHTYYIDFFTLAFSVLQKREMKFSSRLLVLGMAFGEMQKAYDEQKFDKIPSITDKYINADIDLKTIETLESFKLDIIKSKDLYRSIFIELCSSPYAVKKSVFTQKLIEEEAEGRDMYANMQHNIDILNAYLSDKSIYIENIMINLYTCQRFPITSSGINLWGNYVLLCAIFNTFMMSLIEMSDKEMNDEKFMSYTAQFFKSFVHNNMVEKSILDLYKANNLDNLPALATLVQFL